MCPDLFVYGTLLSGFENPFARILAAETEFLGCGYLRGRLYRVTPRFPGLVLSEDPGDVAHGEIYRLGDPDALLALFDDYEGCAPHTPSPLSMSVCVRPLGSMKGIRSVSGRMSFAFPSGSKI